jgi:hypothetical protein
VISTSPASGQRAATRSITAATVAGAISDGVPPPKNTLVTVRPGASAATASISATSARRQRGSSTVSATWLLKSQYGHLERQNGQCTYTASVSARL